VIAILRWVSPNFGVYGCEMMTMMAVIKGTKEPNARASKKRRFLVAPLIVTVFVSLLSHLI
jgi:hypothetical protein